MLFVYHGDMKTKDFRSSNPEAQEDIRKKAVAAGRSGRTQGEVAAIFGETGQTVNAWMRQYGEGGEKALKAKRRGRPKGGSLEPGQGGPERDGQETGADAIALLPVDAGGGLRSD